MTSVPTLGGVPRSWRQLGAACLRRAACCLLTAALACQSASEEVDHVILITIDTLRADHLGVYGYPRATSPFIDSLATQGVLFQNAVAASSHTAPAHASIFTGLSPLEHQVVANGQILAERFETLAGSLAIRGYETAAFVSVHFLEGLKQGFDLFDVTPMATDRVRFNLSYRPAHATIDRAIEYLTAAERGPKTFTWIHLYDVHEAAVEETRIDPAALRAVAPVSIRTFLEERHGIRGDRINLWLIDRYDALIRRVDRQIQRLYSALEAIGKFGRALWIVTADHGEGLGNHGIWAHDRYLYQEQVRVPLILHFGDRRSSGVRVTALVRHVDLLPTLMALLGARMPAVAARSDHRARIAGQSLLPLMAGEVPSLPFPYAFSQRRPASHRSWKQGTVVALQSHRHKYILHTRGPDEFYDLEADPFESTNMADVHSPEQELMKSTLVRMLADAARQRGDDRASRVIDDKYVEQLRALGYL